MARWAPEETDTMAAIATEIEQNVGTARTVLAIDGDDGTDLERVAASLVRAFEAAGVFAMSAAAPSSAIDELRSDIVQPFRSTGAGAGVLVVHGRGLLAAPTRTLWQWTLWVERSADATERGGDAKTHASAVLDVSDPEHPRRNWNDAC
jgi:hypothetical protein